MLRLLLVLLQHDALDQEEQEGLQLSGKRPPASDTIGQSACVMTMQDSWGR